MLRGKDGFAPLRFSFSHTISNDHARLLRLRFGRGVMSENMPGEEVSDITTLSQLACDTSNGPAVASDIDASRRTGLKPKAEQRQTVSKPQPGQRKAVARMVQDQESEQLRPSQTACTTTDTANFGVTSSADTVLVGRAVSLGLNEETAHLSGISQGNVDRREAVTLEDAAEGGENRRQGVSQGGEEQQEEKEDHELPTEVQDTARGICMAPGTQTH